ncbi:unnamed protein product [Linum trigynum]|uniref:N-acetyltransferase domain-containing protein n=1 Tax=Linum trigynum TaxID=586398 RepID=A0AAV2FIX0_9ROSI
MVEELVLIREYNKERDAKMVGKLEMSCENIGSSTDIDNERVSIFGSIMGDPLRRIRLYPVHVMLVAELHGNGELVGMVRCCIKSMKTGLEAANVRMGCILGLRVSPIHRRMGIGTKLVKSAEEWLIGKGAEDILIATLKNNLASTNLFASKFGYADFASLVIFVHHKEQIPRLLLDPFPEIKVEKLQIEQAISLYKNKLRSGNQKHVIYPVDFDAILKANLSLGTWISYFNGRGGTDTTRLRSTIVFSVWNSCEPNNTISHNRRVNKRFQLTLSRARDRFLPCLRFPISDSPQPPPPPGGFLFLYGIYGEGERQQELTRSVWGFVMKLGENMRGCKAIITELAVSDPLLEFVPKESCSSCVDDVWYLKKVAEGSAAGGGGEEDQNESLSGERIGNVFVDPRDF